MKIGSMSFGAFALLLLAGCAPQPTPPQLSNGGSAAQITKNMTVASGTTARVDFVTSINPDCSEIPGSSVRTAVEPTHGVVTIKRSEEFAYFPPANPRSNCNSRRVSGWLILYRSESGFSGLDTFAYDRFSGSGVAWHVAVNAHIE